MNRWFLRAFTRAVLVVACGGLAGCHHAPKWLSSSDGSSGDASATDGSGGGGPGPGGTGAGGAGGPGASSTGAGAAGAGGGDAGTGGAGQGGMDEARVNEIRDCMKARWGKGTTRDVLDVLDDFYACTTPAENTGNLRDALFEAVCKGWVELDPTNTSRFRLVH